MIYYPKRTDKTLYKNLVTQCRKMELEFAEEEPSLDDMNSNYKVGGFAKFGWFGWFFLEVHVKSHGSFFLQTDGSKQDLFSILVSGVLA